MKARAEGKLRYGLQAINYFNRPMSLLTNNFKAVRTVSVSTQGKNYAVETFLFSTQRKSNGENRHILHSEGISLVSLKA